MKQTLILHSKWKTALSTKDMNELKCFFELHQQGKLLQTAELFSNTPMHLVPLYRAINHCNELLITSLIENKTPDPFEFRDVELTYVENNKRIDQTGYTIDPFLLAPSCSTFWTFIFSQHAEIASIPRHYLVARLSNQ
ncbi:hypothetical protein [Amphibacillus sediminis]|uniref:hypothetical protein n=1 Tax=Amphibacillus sediminis TaxID=360185 RepID=UPI0008316CA4|nr:hypothetical protein [Amphibacillus sediminis]